MQIPYHIIRSNRKTISLQIKPDGEVVVRCPQRMSAGEINTFLDSKADWIRKHLAKLPSEPVAKFSEQELEELRQIAKILLTQRVQHYAPIVGVTYNRITVRAQHSRWGSCSSKGNLNFNCLLALVPSEVLDYVVVHELCHRLELNHSHRFWNEVKRVLPDYKQRQTWLKENGAQFIARL